MTRATAPLVAAALAALPAIAGAQTPPTSAIVGRVEAENRRPLEGARLTLHTGSGHGLDWVRRTNLETRPPTTTVTTRSGRFRLPSEAAGTLVVIHASGLGALVPRSVPGSPELIVCRPLGELRLVGAAEDDDLRLHVRVAPSAGEPVEIGRFDGRSARLPAGAYQVLAESPHRCYAFTARIVPGQLTAVALPTGTSAWPGPPAATVHAPDWPHVALRRGADGFPVLDSPLGRSVVERHTEPSGSVWFVERRPGGGGVEPAAVRAVHEITVRAEGGPVAGAIVGAIDARDRLVAAARTDPRGTARLRVPTTADSITIVAWHAGFAPTRAPVRGQRVVLALPAGRTVRLRAIGADGHGVADALVSLDNAGDTRRSWTDRRGETTIRDVAVGDHVLSIAHESHLPFEAVLDVGLVPTREVATVTLAAGLALDGVAYLDRDRTARNAIVELRDPTGRFLRSPRTTVTDRRGRFRFAGLPDEPLTLFAQLQMDGVTWSGRLTGLQAGTSTEWRVDLRNEDPPPPGSGRR